MGHRPVVDRLAGAPISWGVCEAPDWGYELPPGRVLAEMAGLGLKATELAGAPISGRQRGAQLGLRAPTGRVLAEMAGLGLKATELGPTGYLGVSSRAVRDQLRSHGLRLVGGFCRWRCTSVRTWTSTRRRRRCRRSLTVGPRPSSWRPNPRTGATTARS